MINKVTIKSNTDNFAMFLIALNNKLFEHIGEAVPQLILASIHCVYILGSNFTEIKFSAAVV